jgi:intracellular septation protein A
MVLGAVGRRLVPNLIEATLIPSALFFASALFLDLRAAFLVALCWSYVAIGRRLVARRQIPALVLLGSVGLTVRTLLAVTTGSAYLYFIQPVIGTVIVGLAFLASIVLDRPLIARFAHDFCPLAPDIEGRPGVIALYRHLTYLWAAVNFIAAATTFTLLRSVPVGLFVALRPLACWVITVTGVVLTVTTAVRVARREGLGAAVSPDGTLTAMSLRV